MEQPTLQQLQAQSENIQNSAEYENSYEDDYFEEDYEDYDEYDYEDAENSGEEDEGFDFAIQNKVMKNKKFKTVNTASEDVEEESQEATLKSGKFKGADKIYNQILWDEKLNKNDFIVGYEDRFVGLLEEPFSTFEALKEDIPFHRIRFFKRGNEIVWDRKKKLNKI